MVFSLNNLESFKSIRTDFERQVEIIDSLVTLHKPLKTIPAQTLAANKIGGCVTNTAATLDDLTKRTLELSKLYCDGKVVSILEGGYDLNALQESSEMHVNALLEFN